MPSLVNSPYVSLIPHAEAEQLKGDKARAPLKAGQMIIAHGTFEDGTETGAGIFLILRQCSAKEYKMAPFGSVDPYWEGYLAGSAHVTVMLMRQTGDAIPADKELLRRWRIVSEAGEAPKKNDYAGFPKTILDGMSKKWKFLNELVVSERPPPEVGNDPPLKICVKTYGA